MQSTEAASGRATSSKKLRMLAIGMLATTALSIPAASAVTSVSTSAAFGWRPTKPPVATPYSHRLAVGIAKPASLRLV